MLRQAVSEWKFSVFKVFEKLWLFCDVCQKPDILIVDINEPRFQDETIVIRRYYSGVQRGDEIINVRDSVLLKSGTRKKDPHFVARVSGLWEEDDGKTRKQIDTTNRQQLSMVCTPVEHINDFIKPPATGPNMVGVGSYCVRLHAAKSLTGFKLCATTPINTQQHVTGCANGGNMKRPIMLCPFARGFMSKTQVKASRGFNIFASFLWSVKLRANGRSNSQHCAKRLTGSKLCATTPNNSQQSVQTDATCNIRQYWELLANSVVSVCTGLYVQN